MERLQVSIAHEEAAKKAAGIKESVSQYGPNAGYVEWCVDRFLATVAEFIPDTKPEFHVLTTPKQHEETRNYAHIFRDASEAKKILWVICKIGNSLNIYTFTTFYEDHFKQERFSEDFDQFGMNHIHQSEFLRIAHGGRVAVDPQNLARFKEGLT
ncbi:MAG TPA: hypothetical protein VKC89_01395 [Patescibacteria group bacterium]|nr:hypothetical protein [Patescibacteria group bacterium]